jgi:hypothetical protein
MKFVLRRWALWGSMAYLGFRMWNMMEEIHEEL